MNARFEGQGKTTLNIFLQEALYKFSI